MDNRCAVYVLGKLGGPYKIGCSNNPKNRLSQVKYIMPGAQFMNDNAIIWHEHWFDIRELAEKSEKTAHKILHEFRLDRDHGLPSWAMRTGKPPEWFFCSLTRAIRAVDRAGNTHKQLTEVLNPEDLRDD